MKSGANEKIILGEEVLSYEIGIVFAWKKQEICGIFSMYWFWEEKSVGK